MKRKEKKEISFEAVHKCTKRTRKDSPRIGLVDCCLLDCSKLGVGKGTDITLGDVPFWKSALRVRISILMMLFFLRDPKVVCFVKKA